MYKRDILLITLVILSFVILGILGIKLRDEDLIKQGIIDCEAKKINSFNKLYEEITEKDELKKLCHNLNCSDYFDKKIEINNQIINQTLSYDCEEAVEKLFGQNR